MLPRELHILRRLTRRNGIASLAAITLLLLLYVTVRHTGAPSLAWRKSPTAAATQTVARIDLAEVVGSLLEQYRPSDIEPDWSERHPSSKWYWGEAANETDRLELPAGEEQKMQRAHAGFVAAVRAQLPVYVPSRVDKDNRDDGPRQGIVTIGGGKYFVILLVSLRFLRRAGTTLPVEVFVPAHEYEADVCEHVLPALNAACRILPALGGGARSIGGFQLKAFALLFASFDDVFFLDADCTAMHDLASVFASVPFQQTGLVVWPDYWQTTVAPAYYRIAGQTPVPVAQRPSSETGQVALSKARHWHTLLLLVYYNYYGPAYYYQLLNQGGTGMGDKETFLPAAAVFGLPAYHVRTPVVAVGHRFEDGSTGSRVQIQRDPGEDYAVTQALSTTYGAATANGGDLARLNRTEWEAAYADVRPLLLHLSWPKWDALNLLDHISKWSDMTTGVDGRPEPAFHYPAAEAAQIHGAERMLWEEAMWTVCRLHGRLRHWRKSKKKAERMCGRLTSHFRRVLDGDVGRQMGIGPDDVLYPKLADEEM